MMIQSENIFRGPTEKVQPYKKMSITRQPSNLSAKKIVTIQEILNRLQKALLYMDATYLKNPPIEKVAVACNLSVFHFFRCFKQVFAMTPYQYLLIKRLEFSMQLVLEHRQTIARIADICGFADQFTFSKAFKRYFGKSPSAVRKELISGIANNKAASN